MAIYVRSVRRPSSLYKNIANAVLSDAEHKLFQGFFFFNFQNNTLLQGTRVNVISLMYST